MIYTIGHSTLTEAAFLEIANEASLIIDIRSHPTSKWPQFRKEEMECWLPAAGKAYEWWPSLGGWDVRHAYLKETLATREVDLEPYLHGKFPKQRIAATKHSNYPSWTSVGLWDYQWYMCTVDFLGGVAELIKCGGQSDVGITCCECLWWKCHRSMVADYLAFRDVEAVHLQPKRTRHRAVLGNRLDRYHADVIRTWNGELAPLA